jgi:FtsZ-binding cell division protein ZapB
MSALETVKELGRMATTATLTKDVIDLFAQQVALLEKQVATLEQENASLKTENVNLQKQVTDLRQELDGVRPKTGSLQEGTEKLLQLLFERNEITVGVAASVLGISHGMADYYRGALTDAGMAVWTRVGIQTDWGAASESVFGITQEGREYAVKRGLAT